MLGAVRCVMLSLWGKVDLWGWLMPGRRCAWPIGCAFVCRCWCWNRIREKWDGRVQLSQLFANRCKLLIIGACPMLFWNSFLLIQLWTAHYHDLRLQSYPLLPLIHLNLYADAQQSFASHLLRAGLKKACEGNCSGAWSSPIKLRMRASNCDGGDVWS